ncbi:MAG: hypothetical protein P0Y53_10630 [Candidatus Pseudobacter hemicellulosilyticus]|uniref:Uncharacterized protein n=1 Tax=Candidatus Pseudobacter hemicellulosilyticus TaxID=3121375 RepID=A0AAJ6BHP8_9BACT|nr:MAG: hypothetical protein P0Y53_10630 [Pseudobacter sp.]
MLKHIIGRLLLLSLAAVISQELYAQPGTPGGGLPGSPGGNPGTPPVLCDEIITSRSCRSIITDTAFNPYVTGVLGAWRSNKAYTYYARRKESDPSVATNIRRDGTFNDYTAFWKFQQAVLKPQQDTSRWVWNSELTLLNRKGLEVENRDPLGRYNAGLYGYGLSLPVAVVQNSRYRESAFEGFEDYDFQLLLCDTSCESIRHFNINEYRNDIVTTEKHSGKSSLRIEASEDASFNFPVLPADEDDVLPPLVFSLKPSECNQPSLDNIKISNQILLPTFTPVRGTKMLISAWVKEEQDCKCAGYTNSRIVLFMQRIAGNTVELVFTPKGNIIDGWQRFEGEFALPEDGTGLTVSLQSTGNSVVYFDDLRIHPYHANMRSFVFHPVKLRLMAELDENNYASFYEYDEEGTLVRLKKETERGIKTIQETRSALLKQ